MTQGVLLIVRFPIFFIGQKEGITTLHFSTEQAFDYIVLHQTREKAELFLSQGKQATNSIITEVPTYQAASELLLWFQEAWNRQQPTPCPMVLWDCPVAQPETFLLASIEGFLEAARPT